jgi:hypothetical protein
VALCGGFKIYLLNADAAVRWLALIAQTSSSVYPLQIAHHFFILTKKKVIVDAIRRGVCGLSAIIAAVHVRLVSRLWLDAFTLNIHDLCSEDRVSIGRSAICDPTVILHSPGAR